MDIDVNAPQSSSPIVWPINMPYGRIGMQLVDGNKVFIHCEIVHWSPMFRRDFILRVRQMVAFLQKHNIQRVYSMIPKNSPLIQKWQQMWGFKPIKEFDDNIIFMREI